MKMIDINPQTRGMIIDNIDHAISVGGMAFKIGKSQSKRSIEQNAKAHAMLADISRQIEHYGKRYSVDVWKRLTLAAWLRERNESPLMIPAIDGCGVDVIFEKTSKLSIKRMADYIQWLEAYGVNAGVVFR